MLFKKNKNKTIEILKIALKKEIDENLTTSKEDTYELISTFEMFKSYKVNKYDNLLNLSVYSSIACSDLLLLTERYQLSNRDYEKRLIARFIALTVVEYVDDINALLGRDLDKELIKNDFNQFRGSFKEINKKFSLVKKENEQLLRKIRNNAIAHRSHDAIKLAKYAYELECEPIYLIGVSTIQITTELTKETTKVFNEIIDSIKQKKQNGS